MALKPEIAELLSGFEKRMKFIHIVRFILDYKYPDYVRVMFPDKEVLDNLIVAVLVFINDRTLGSEQTCTLSDVERFIEGFAQVLLNCTAIDSHVLAKYIIVQVLQKDGELTEYLQFNSKREVFEHAQVRLVNEEKGSYHLTDDAFDFLYRSKEIESEIDFSVTRFRMKEYMKRNNYGQVLDASRELVSRIRNMKQSMDDFLLRCREDISKITVDQYDIVIGRVRALLDNEYQELAEIQNSAKERAQLLLDAQQSGIGNEESRKHRMALSEIIDNISLTIDEQRSLINRKSSLSASYEQLLHDHFLVSRFERMNFEKDLLSLMRRADDRLGDAAKMLLFSLTKPQFARQFSVENFYAPQTRLNLLQEEDRIDLSEESVGDDLVERRNSRFQQICCDFFAFTSSKDAFSISEFVGSLSVSALFTACEENALPNVLLSLYAMQTLDVAAWHSSEHFAVQPMGEFELSWCMEELPDDMLQMKQIQFMALDKPFCFKVQKDGLERSIKMTDFRVEVEK